MKKPPYYFVTYPNDGSRCWATNNLATATKLASTNGAQVYRLNRLLAPIDCQLPSPFNAKAHWQDAYERIHDEN